MLYDNLDTFLSELSKLFNANKNKGGALYVTLKAYDGRRTRNPRKPNDKPKPDTKCPPAITKASDPAPSEYKCLIRARLVNEKISVVIAPKDMNKFQMSFSCLMKGNLSLKKKK